ncbi:MAG: 30S ribosomal protein S4 [Candidatus Levybacteria bacterium]|nr:30S ribosomal protein S4 [Candidatus Levybacteria bacterium]MBI3070247.1 30S ribosomal protein S4 [Candidatus Levybacteria bacterium]MBI3093014.1 30S ribosomal protein S4 [Candidatus Levybacteria bacterium]
MARYTGPKHKLARREGLNVLDKTSASLTRRLNIPPGVHGRKRKKRLSEYGVQLREKQKAKAIYGVLEKQFKRLIGEVQKKRGETGEMLISLLETRLDSLVYRLGFARTRFQARQFVTHGHVLVNEKKVNIPSYRVKEGDVVSLSQKLQKNPALLELLKEKRDVLPFLKRMGTSGKLLRMPKREDAEVPFNTQLIVEYYSR